MLAKKRELSVTLMLTFALNLLPPPNRHEC